MRQSVVTRWPGNTLFRQSATNVPRMSVTGGKNCGLSTRARLRASHRARIASSVSTPSAGRQRDGPNPPAPFPAKEGGVPTVAASGSPLPAEGGRAGGDRSGRGSTSAMLGCLGAHEAAVPGEDARLDGDEQGVQQVAEHGDREHAGVDL